MCLLADHKERMAFTLGKELLFLALPRFLLALKYFKVRSLLFLKYSRFLFRCFIVSCNIFGIFFLKKSVLVFFVLISSLSSSPPISSGRQEHTMAENMGKRDDGKRKKRQKSFSFVRKSDEKKRESSFLFSFFLPGRNGPHFLLFTPLFLFLRRIVVCSREVGKCPTFTPTSLFFQQFFRLFSFSLKWGTEL